MRSGTISQVEINQRLVGDANLLCEILEVADRALVHPESNLTFEPARIWVFLSL